MGNRTANRVQSLTTAPVSKDRPLSNINGPRGRCPCASHGLSRPAPIVGEGRACTCRGQCQSCKWPGSKWRIQPSIWERRSLLEGMCIGEPEQSLRNRGNQSTTCHQDYFWTSGWMDRLVGFGADGAAVNMGCRGGVIALLKEEVGEHVIPLHCMPHSGGCQVDQVLQEWQLLKTIVRTTFKDKSYLGLWQTLLTKEPYCSDSEISEYPTPA
ncbi:hypothetical protein ILYODFUR_021337 [Ilyodon furcidens]|uniref:Transposase n=1 Tax=Ilyodon furcidens TaxID=33524 RepID=A0ABV0SPU9_9TELE